jgi:glutamyl-tRNA synthetase
VRTALFNYLFARRENGCFILRVEDTDRERSLPVYRDALIEDLAWMGIRWDEGPGVEGPYGPYQQSERLEIYRRHVERLIADGKAYPCYVTEEETEELRRVAKLERRPPRFDNRGRYFTAEEINARKARGIRPTVRFKIENPQLRMRDLVRGEVSFNLDEMMGDFVIQRADGTPTFHLAVCVDDGLMKITHVIRGEDHLSNTPKHILLLRALGYEPPQYGHLSLIHGPGGEPLSKRLESISVRHFRKQGYLPGALANYIALLGWAPGDNREIFPEGELEKIFDIGQINKSASNYDPEKLDWVNGQHLRMLGDEEFAKRALAYLKAEGLLKWDETLVHRVLGVFKDNISRFEELPDRLAVLDDEFDYENAEWLKGAEKRELLRAAVEVLPTLRSADEALYEDFVNAVKAKVPAKGKHLFMPIRLALTGKEHGPELKRIFPALGTERIRKRFERALARSGD